VRKLGDKIVLNCETNVASDYFDQAYQMAKDLCDLRGEQFKCVALDYVTIVPSRDQTKLEFSVYIRNI
jgi:hypothetical protein